MMMKLDLDDSSTIPVMTGESLPAELTQELMDIQVNSDSQEEKTSSIKV
jgi:hypothetical protein